MPELLGDGKLFENESNHEQCQLESHDMFRETISKDALHDKNKVLEQELILLNQYILMFKPVHNLWLAT